MRVNPISYNQQPYKHISMKRDTALNVAMIEDSTPVSAKKDEAILKYLESAEKREKQSMWAVLVPTMLTLPLVYYFFKKGGMLGSKNVIKDIQGGFKSLSNDNNIPTLQTCKSINPKLKAFLEKQVNHAKASDEQLRLTGKPQPAKKLLLYGPPGTGKTFFAKIFAKTLGADYLEIRYTDLSKRYVGEQMEHFKNTFEDVINTAIKNKNKKYVLTFNEIDALIATQEHMVETGGGHVSTKIEERNAFLNYMDDIATKAPNITVIGTTNRIANNASLDGAAMSRFGDRIQVDFPDRECLYEALKAHLLYYGEDFVKANNNKISELAETMNKRNYSFRDLECMLNDAKSYHLDDCLRDSSVKFKFDYLTKAQKSRSITDGESAAN